MNIFLIKLYNLIHPLRAFAQINNNSNNPTGTNPNISSGAGINNIQINFENPLGGNGGVNSIMQLLAAIIDIVITIGIPIVTLAIIYTGFLFVKARGDKKAIKEARNAFTWTIIGAIILMASWVIAQAIHGTVTQIITS